MSVVDDTAHECVCVCEVMCAACVFVSVCLCVRLVCVRLGCVGVCVPLVPSARRE